MSAQYRSTGMTSLGSPENKIHCHKLSGLLFLRHVVSIDVIKADNEPSRNIGRLLYRF